MRSRGQKKNKTGLGRALVKSHEQYQKNKSSKPSDVSPAQKLGSVLESTSLDEFITAAVLSERDFTAKRDKQHAIILESDASIARAPRKRLADFSFEHLSVPRRPQWRRDQTATEVDRQEKEGFYVWRREIAAMEEEYDTRKVTPYEKNIEVWRQLWRVLERSDIVLQIVDARNPLFYYSRDLVKYSRELQPPKPMLILVNKSDYLTDKQRQLWAQFFLREGWAFIFYSAYFEQSKLNEAARARRDNTEEADQPAPLPCDEDHLQLLCGAFAEIFSRSFGIAGNLQSSTSSGAQAGVMQGEATEKDENRNEEAGCQYEGTGAEEDAAENGELENEHGEEEENEHGEEEDEDGEEDDEDGEEEEDEAGVEYDEDEQEEEEDDGVEGDAKYGEEHEEGEVDEDEEEGADSGEGLCDQRQDKTHEETSISGVELDPVPPDDSKNDFSELHSTNAASTVNQHADNSRQLLAVRARKILNRLELMRLLNMLGNRLGIIPQDRHDGRLCVGMVGYPNVGKSSVINTLLGVTPLDHVTARVSVGPTPGKTKHFQTLVLTSTLMLCDCPGLVFPSFVSSAAEMICAGVLPLSQMRDVLGPAEILAQRIPRAVLNATYTIRIPPAPVDDADAAPTARELLETYCKRRGYLSGGSGEADINRGARDLLKDYVGGQLLYCCPPPGLLGAGKDLFLRETRLASVQSEKVKRKLEMEIALFQREEAATAAEAENPGPADGEQATEDESTIADDQEYNDDEDEGDTSGSPGRGGTGRSHTRTKKWGKKGKKLRNKTPYEETDMFGQSMSRGAMILDRKLAKPLQKGHTLTNKHAHVFTRAQSHLTHTSTVPSNTPNP